MKKRKSISMNNLPLKINQQNGNLKCKAGILFEKDIDSVHLNNVPIKKLGKKLKIQWFIIRRRLIYFFQKSQTPSYQHLGLFANMWIVNLVLSKS